MAMKMVVTQLIWLLSCLAWLTASAFIAVTFIAVTFIAVTFIAATTLFFVALTEYPPSRDLPWCRRCGRQIWEEIAPTYC
jgi:hypothetical protein